MLQKKILCLEKASPTTSKIIIEIYSTPSDQSKSRNATDQKKKKSTVTNYWTHYKPSLMSRRNKRELFVWSWWRIALWQHNNADPVCACSLIIPKIPAAQLMVMVYSKMTFSLIDRRKKTMRWWDRKADTLLSYYTQ